MTRAREAARLIGNNTFRLDSNNAVGFNSTTPDAMFDINQGLTVAGVSTFTGNVIMSGDLTVNGTTTTLDTIVQEVDLMNIQANSSTPGLGVTQSGTGDIAKFYDGTSAVFTIADGGNVTVESGTLTLNNNLDLQDSDKILLGSSDDLQIFHDGSNSYIKEAGTGNVILEVTDATVEFKKGGGEHLAKFIPDGAVELYYDNSKKFETRTGGATVTGDFNISGELNLVGGSDSAKFLDVQVGTNAFNIRKVTGGDTGHETMAAFTGDGAVDLYYDNSKKFETTNTGVTITGTLAATAVTGDGSQLTGLPEGTNILKAMLFA